MGTSLIAEASAQLQDVFNGINSAAGIVTNITVVAVFGWKVKTWIRKGVDRHEQNVKAELLAILEHRLEEQMKPVFERLAAIEEQFKPNHGSSSRDQWDRIERAVIELAERVAAME